MVANGRFCKFWRGPHLTTVWNVLTRTRREENRETGQGCCLEESELSRDIRLPSVDGADRQVVSAGEYGEASPCWKHGCCVKVVFQRVCEEHCRQCRGRMDKRQRRSSYFWSVPRFLGQYHGSIQAFSVSTSPPREKTVPRDGGVLGPTTWRARDSRHRQRLPASGPASARVSSVPNTLEGVEARDITKLVRPYVCRECL